MRGATIKASQTSGRIIFQSTHLLRGATGTGKTRNWKKSYFNPRTSCEVRHWPSPAVPVPDDFNPRTSCEVRPAWWGDDLLVVIFQIHAPLARCDNGIFAHALCALFQSTHLLRGATQPHDQSLCPVAFQSTHLLRGATQCFFLVCIAIPISIHAPLARCDRKHGCGLLRFRHFNPRTSCEVRQRIRNYPLKT